MSKCQQCASLNNDGICTKCRKKRKKLVIVFMVIFFISYLLIGNIGLYINEERTKKIDVPSQLTRETIVEFPIEKTVCSERSYRFSTLGGNVNSIRGNVQPVLEITNLEERWGLYKVNFSFIDESKFPYEIYGGNNLQEKLLSEEISHDDADFYSENYDFYLGPGESIVIDETTPQQDTSKQYWAIANIKEPIIEECKKITEFINRTINKTYTEYKTIEQKINERQFKTIKDIIGINYLEWCIIWFLLFLIIILFMKIRGY